MPIDLNDCLLSVTTMSFDIFVQELWWPLMVGAKVFLASKDVPYDEERLKGLIEESCSTVMQGTPALWQMLINAGWEPKQELRILSGGDLLSYHLAKKLLSGTADGLEFVWAYGGNRLVLCHESAC